MGEGRWLNLAREFRNTAHAIIKISASNDEMRKYMDFYIYIIYVPYMHAEMAKLLYFDFDPNNLGLFLTNHG